jgi:hypothetical protein
MPVNIGDLVCISDRHRIWALATNVIREKDLNIVEVLDPEFLVLHYYPMSVFRFTNISSSNVVIKRRRPSGRKDSKSEETQNLERLP